MRKIFILFLFIISSNCFSQDNWQIIEPNWSGNSTSSIYYINSFDDGHLILLTDGNIYHFFPDDLTNISLINFTDWGASLKSISGKSQSEMIFYGMNYNSFNFPIDEYRRDFYKFFKDTSKSVGDWGYKYQVYGFDADGSSNANIIYSNVNTDGIGISVAKYKMWTYSYTNWKETNKGLKEEYEAHCGTFHNQKNYIVAVNKQNQIDILSSIDGSEWVMESTPRNFKYNKDEKIVKLIINNENDYYIFTKKAIYYSINSGKNWNIIDLKFYEINDAALRNQNEIYFCGNFGFIAKFDLKTFKYEIFTNSIKFELFTLHFTQNGDCWIGGKSPKLIKYNFGTSVDELPLKFDFYSNIFPNPTSNYITIHTPDDLKNSEVSKIQIFDILGIEVMTELINPRTASHQINIEKLHEGMYFIRIGNYSQKFVVVK